MLVSEFIAAAGPLRPTLQDAAGDRWSDDTLRGLLTDAVRQMFGDHPETRVVDAYSLQDYPASTLATSDTVPVEPVYFSPLQHLVLFLAYGLDAKDEGNRNQAANHLAAYEKVFSGVS